MDDTRPKWTHKTPEDVARWLVGDHVTKVTHHWKMTGVDTSTEWLMLHKDKDSRQFSTNFFRDNPEFEFAPYHAGLVRERPYAKVRETIDKIDAWEKANARDRSEFERLKKKFGG